MKIKTDIDIDLADRNLALAYLNHVPASMENKQSSGAATIKHNTGVYFQNIPTDPLTNLSSIHYGEAEDLGYFKIDFINNSIYHKVKNNAHLEVLMNTEPDWTLLHDQSFVDQLAHIRDHYDIVRTIDPKSVEDLAVILAIIRPGKRHLLKKPRTEIDKDIWTAPVDGSYHFKKAHAFAYAVSIAVQMNLLSESAIV